MLFPNEFSLILITMFLLEKAKGSQCHCSPVQVQTLCSFKLPVNRGAKTWERGNEWGECDQGVGGPGSLDEHSAASFLIVSRILVNQNVVTESRRIYRDYRGPRSDREEEFNEKSNRVHRGIYVHEGSRNGHEHSWLGTREQLVRGYVSRQNEMHRCMRFFYMCTYMCVCIRIHFFFFFFPERPLSFTKPSQVSGESR